MSQFALFGQRRFAPFFWTQALGAFNDNAFRNALLMLVAFQLGLDDHAASVYTNFAPALFILPFFLFSASAGQLAEKFEKTRIIRWVKLFEIAAMAIAAVGFITHHVSLLLVVLFMMGLHSTVFGPIKYAILPQALKPAELVGGNGLVEMGTQLAMLLGMIAGNVVMGVAGVGPWLAAAVTIAVAVTGYLACRAIPPAAWCWPRLARLAGNSACWSITSSRGWTSPRRPRRLRTSRSGTPWPTSGSMPPAWAKACISW